MTFVVIAEQSGRIIYSSSVSADMEAVGGRDENGKNAEDKRIEMKFSIFLS